MAVCRASMPSYTYAMKGEKLLNARGIPCEIKRNENTSPDGCGYSLLISGDCRNAAAILRSYSIPYTDIKNGGV